MTELLAALIGVVAGAVASGAVQSWQQAQQRSLTAKVAARVILGDLYAAEDDAKRLLRFGTWPSTPPSFQRELATWAAQREPFAAVVDATDWSVVASAYHNLDLLGQVLQIKQPDAQLDASERAAVEDVRERLDRASETVAQYAAPERERERVVRELGQGLDA